MNPELIQLIIAIVLAIGTSLAFHFITVGRLKDKIHQLEIQMKELEKKDALQEQSLNQVHELFPAIHEIIVLHKNRGGRK